MSKEIYISSTPHETRLAIVESDALTEIYYERENEYTLAGSIYNGKVTRVLPGMQSSFVDIGLERDAFLYITDFMEEAGDSADFEANANQGDAARAPRGDRDSNRGRGDRGRNDRGDRPDRSEQPQLPAEPTDADLFSEAVSSLDPARPVTTTRSDSDRSDRGRRGGRNRRDRNLNSDGTPRRDRNQTPPIDGNRVETPAIASTFTPPPPMSIVDDSGDEVGEAAPGADGSRRWRGRRGRRGNRGTGTEITAQPVASTDSEDTQTPSYESFDSPSYSVADATANEPVQEQASATETERTPRSSSERGRRDRNDRGDRGGRNSGGDRGPRDSSSAQPPRVPRGFAPSRSLYKVDGSADETTHQPTEPRPYGQEEEIAAPSEPVILPGESLSKYRPGGAAPVQSKVESAVPATSTEFNLPSSWDGGLVLPGETLRRRDPASISSEASSITRSSESRDSRSSHGGERDRDRGRNDRGGRDSRGGRGGRDNRPARTSDTEFSAPAEMQQAEITPLPKVIQAVATNESETLSASHHSERVHSTFIAPPPVPHTPEPATLAPQAEVEADFEPTEASASFRVDPVPPSEYRQPAPTPDPAHVEAAEPQHLQTEAETPQHTHDAAVSAPETHEISPDYQLAYEASGLPTDQPAHEITDISASGEMLSESEAVDVPTPEAQHDLPAAETGERFAAAHEHNILDAPIAPIHQHFAPGDGDLEEEEFIDDEDSADALPTLHAHTHEVEDAHAGGETETLEGAADLGTMLREMSIDQITRSEPSVTEDEEDFDEDFLEEDQDFDSEIAGADSDFEEEEHTPEEGPDEAEESAYAEQAHHSEGEGGERLQTASQPAETARQPRREDGRRDGRRGDRNRRSSGDRDRSSDRSGSADRSASTRSGSDRSGSDRSSSDRSSSDRSSSDRSSSDRSGSDRSSSERGGGTDRRDSRGGRGSRSMQTTNLPAISELLKPGQEILCQIAKEPIAKKGARITSHIALPGRFLVFMPTVNHTGVSRKIESDGERRRLKEILLSEKGEASGGFIVRTAAAGASEEELRSDLRFLLNLWTDIKQRSESSKSPALIYHDLNLVERVLRDQVTDNFSAIWVDTETEYERVLRFLQRFQPSLIRRVKLYTKEMPLFEQFGITEEINKALRSKVWLKSGGSIVINQTEALVAIDINTGKFVGKTARLEDTIVKTNLDAIPEIVRQIRLRDLGGIIIIDFIDMDERKNRNKVMAALEDELKSDRAPSKVLQFNDFGLVAITRKRVKQSLERTLSTTCGVCTGTGMVKSPVTVCNDIYVEMRKMHKNLDRGDVMLRVHPEVVKQLKAPSTHWLQEMEEMCGKTILVKSDPSLHPEQFDIH